MPNKFSYLLALCHHCFQPLQQTEESPADPYFEWDKKVCSTHGDFFIGAGNYDREKNGAFWDYPIVKFQSGRGRLRDISELYFQVIRKREAAMRFPKWQSVPGYCANWISDRVIQCDQTMEIFLSVGLAAEALGLREDCISKVLRGVIRHTGGYTFTYIGINH